MEEEKKKMNNNNNVTTVISTARKRKRGERVFRFVSFCEPGYPTDFHGDFRENIKELVGFGYPESSSIDGMQCWSFQLELHHYPSSCVRLYVAEESVGMSLYRQCHYCRSVGWGHHMICNKRFHFVLPSKGCIPQMEDLSIYVSSKSTYGGIKAADDQSSTNKKLMGSSQRQYLLHGVMHSNGFGHLIFINGIHEGGSDFISGHQILDLWDRICTALQMRKVSLTDVAKKGSMELRLIHGLAYGQPWFGRWGYKFGHGTYGVTCQMYQTSLEALRGVPLFLLVPHFACAGRDIPTVIAKYQTISGHTLQTLADLIRFMLELDRRLPQNSPTTLNYSGIISEAMCRWSMKRVQMAAQVIVESLKKSESQWVTRQEVRDAARAYIGDTGLLDYVLKSLGNHIVGDYIVRRTVNPVTKVLEYCLEDVSTVFPRFGRNGSARFHVTKVHLSKDLLYLYKHILREQCPTGVFGAIPMAVRVVLDTKHLVKEFDGGEHYDGNNNNEHIMRVTCTIRVLGDQEKKGLVPYETVIVPTSATISDFKKAVDVKFKDMYWGLKNFVAESVLGVNVEECRAVLGLIGTQPGNVVVVEGRIDGLGIGDEEVYEGGNEIGTIDCLCGASEEDGEQMVCCDICEVKQHTRCARIDVDGEEGDDDQMHRVFLCNKCENNIVTLPSIQY